MGERKMNAEAWLLCMPTRPMEEEDTLLKIPCDIKRPLEVSERSFLLELPEDIIFHILSYITNRERIRLGLTSKPLLSSVRKCPNLALSDHRIIQDEGNIDHVKRYRQELKYILSTLTRYDRENIQLETFTLQPKYVRNAPHDRCIKLAEKRGVRNLKLLMRECKRVYVLPESAFRVESLVELELKSCIIDPKDRKITWPNLKRLKIIEYCIINQEAFENIISGCPKIENLTVDWVLFDVKLGNLRNLKQLEIKINASRCLEVINTPNLESMSCFNHGTVNFRDNEYLSLKSLELHFGGIDEHLFINFARKFPKLENLHLKCNGSLQRINLSSATLKKLKLSGCDWEEVCFDVPNLIYFEYWGKIIRKLSFAGNSGRWISSIELLESGNKVDAAWFRELTEFLAALSKSETSVSVKLMRSVAISLNHEEVRTIATSATPIISEFSINTSWLKKSTKSSSVRALLDFILLVCQPRTVKFLDCKSSKYDLPWHFYQILISTSSRDRGGVTDFEMVQRSSNYREESRLSSGFENWDTKVWAVLNASKEFIFYLEYGSENLHMKKKRKLDVPCWTSDAEQVDEKIDETMVREAHNFCVRSQYQAIPVALEPSQRGDQKSLLRHESCHILSV